MRLRMEELRRAFSEDVAVNYEKVWLPDEKGCVFACPGAKWPQEIVCTSSMGMTMEELVPLLDDKGAQWK